MRGVCVAAVVWGMSLQAGDAPEPLVRLITLDPGHFHAALIHKEELPEVARDVHVYAPLGPDLAAHLGRIAAYNRRERNPTHWRLDVRAGDDYFERFLAERPGNVVVLSGRNRGKLARIKAAVDAGLHVLADKPWVIEAADLPLLDATLDAAAARGVVAYDAMTQRFETTCLLQKALVNDPAVFGECLPGTAEEPAVSMESLHYLLKQVSGVPSLRPVWFFDVGEQGEGLADVGTHLADLVAWTLCEERMLDPRGDTRLVGAARRPTMLSAADFERVTGVRGFPEFLAGAVEDGGLAYFCNTRVDYTLRGVHVRLAVAWDFAPAPGEADRSSAVFRGTRARVEVRQGKDEGFVPQVFVVPNDAGRKAEVLAAVGRRLASLAGEFPGLAAEDLGDRIGIAIPAALRTGHEAHFALLVRRFIEYVRQPASLPSWEAAHMRAKYFVTTEGVAAARRAASR